MGDFWREFLIHQAIQTVLGLVSVAMMNPNSSTFRNLRGPLRVLRNGLNTLPLDDPPLTTTTNVNPNNPPL